MSRQSYDPMTHIAENLEILAYGHSSDNTLPERQVKALESIAASLEKMANPPVEVQPERPHVTSTDPGRCQVLVEGQWVLMDCKEHISLPPMTEAIRRRSDCLKCETAYWDCQATPEPCCTNCAVAYTHPLVKGT